MWVVVIVVESRGWSSSESRVQIQPEKTVNEVLALCAGKRAPGRIDPRIPRASRRPPPDAQTLATQCGRMLGSCSVAERIILKDGLVDFLDLLHYPGEGWPGHAYLTTTITAACISQHGSCRCDMGAGAPAGKSGGDTGVFKADISSRKRNIFDE